MLIFVFVNRERFRRNEFSEGFFARESGQVREGHSSGVFPFVLDPTQDQDSGGNLSLGQKRDRKGGKKMKSILPNCIFFWFLFSLVRVLSVCSFDLLLTSLGFSTFSSHDLRLEKQSRQLQS